jgi:hypothetical protein
MEKVSKKVRLTVKAKNAALRASGLTKKFEGWSEDVREAAAAFEAAAKKLVKALDAVPADWEVPRGQVGRPPLQAIEVGQVVNITDRAAASYADVLEDEERVALRVTKVEGNRLVCETVTRVKVVVPRGHVRAA